jgi:hypothetical protein
VKYKRVKKLIKYLKDPIAATAVETDIINEPEVE